MWSRLKQALCLALTGCMLVSVLPGAALAAAPFADVPAGSWYEDAVSYVYSNSLMSGIVTQTFDPEGIASRGQVVTILYRMEGQPTVSGKSSFKDVYADYYQKAVIWAEKNGIVTGTETGLFQPAQSVTREQMAAFFYRYAAYKKFNVSQKASTVYSDQWQISTYALNAMRWAVGIGLISGTDQNTLCPKDDATRGQLAVALMRFCNQYKITFASASATTAVTAVSATKATTATATSTAATSTTPGAAESTVVTPTVVEGPAYTFRWPVQGTVSSGFGSRFIFGSTSFHRGLDIPAAVGMAVHAGQTGTVSFAGEQGSYGNLVILDHGNGYQSYYGHNSQILVQKGDVVVQGQTIAAAGQTGRATGPHCHFEIHYMGQLVDPTKHLPAQNNAPTNEMVVASGT